MDRSEPCAPRYAANPMRQNPAYCEELHSYLLQCVMVRRLKSEQMKGLQPIIRQVRCHASAPRAPWRSADARGGAARRTDV